MELEKLGFYERMYIKINLPGVINKTTFFRLLAITQKAGLGIRDSLNSIEKSETHAGMRRIIKDLISKVNQGLTLSIAMEGHRYFFSGEEIELIRSSESMGNLPEVLNNISEELDNYQKIRSKIKNAMTYPIMVLIFAIIAVIVLLVKVMPTIVSLFPNKNTLPGITVFMLGASDFIQTKWWLMVGFVMAISAGYKFFYEKILAFKIFIDKLFLELPAIKMVSRRFNLYRISKLLGDFYNAGVSPTIALVQISEILTNYHYRVKILDIKKDLEIGLSFTEAMEGSWLFDPILVQIIGIGEQTGNIGDVLNKMADFYREELTNSIDGMMKLIEPMLMAFIAIIIGVIVASVFLPMGDLVGQIGG